MKRLLSILLGLSLVLGTATASFGFQQEEKKEEGKKKGKKKKKKDEEKKPA